MKQKITKWIRDPRTLRPVQAVVHPAWILAVAVLLVNDHVIKPAAMIEPVAGKLSDFAGLFLAPVLLAALLGARSRRGLWASGAAVGAVFAAINTSPALAATWDGLVSTVVPFVTTPDPTDLIALVAIPAGLLFFEQAMKPRSTRAARRVVEATAVTVGALACVATSPPPCEGEFCGGTTPEQQSQISILNKTNELHVLRVRRLRDRVRIDCDRVSESPNTHLRSGAFGPPQSWFVQSGQEIPVRAFEVDPWSGEPLSEGADRPCHAALVESDSVPDILVFWGGGLPQKSFAFDAEIPQDIPADDNTVVLEADYSRTPDDQMHPWRNRGDCGPRADICGDDLLEPLAEIPDGARYSWRSVSDETLHYVRSGLSGGTLNTIPEACQMPDASDGIAWEQPPSGDFEVVAFHQGRDGCHEIELQNRLSDPENRETRSWWVCAPAASLALLQPGDAPVNIAASRLRTGATFNTGGYTGLRIDVTREGDLMGGGPSQFHRIWLVAGFGVPDEIDFDFSNIVREGCEPQEAACGQVAVPVDVSIGAFGETLAPGESAVLGEVLQSEIHLVRAEARPVLDTNCEAEEGALDLAPGDPGVSVTYMESVVITN